MTDAPKRIPIADADLPTLKAFAEAFLGIEVKPGTNSASLRGAIAKAAPDLKDVPALPPVPVFTPAQAQAVAPMPSMVAAANAAAGEGQAERPAAVSLPASAELAHASRDPKVRLKVLKTDDKRRARDVTIAVNGDVYRLQRGVEVEVPYRVYLALRDAVERAAVPTDEINPFTGEPIMGWEDVLSYPFEIRAMPSDEDIAHWHAATGAGFKAAA